MVPVGAVEHGQARERMVHMVIVRIHMRWLYGSDGNLMSARQHVGMSARIEAADGQ